MLPGKSFSFVDIETTGHHHQRDRIIDIAIIRVDSNNVIDTFQTLINPERHIPEFIQGYTGIFPSDIEFAPTFESVANKIMSMLEGTIFVAHNVGFDYGFIKNELLRAGLEFRLPKMCSIRLARQLYPNLAKYNLSYIIDTFGFECENRHRAYDDAHVIWQFLQHALKEKGQEVVEMVVKHCIEDSYVPKQIDTETLENLPSCPGVYIFYGENEVPLYVGKSIDIKKRVKSHFYGEKSEKDFSISDQVVGIKTIETSGELSALILESRLVKEMIPIYNRQLRRKQEMVIAKKVLNGSGYLTVELERVKKIPAIDAENLLGVYSSLKAAKESLGNKVEKNKLCSKVLGLEKVLTACFKYHLGKCSGACLGKESCEEYNERFEEAFAKEALQKWPYESAVKVVEASNSSENVYVIDKWCLLEETAIKKRSRKKVLSTFDFDVYKIIKNYLEKVPAGVLIEPI